MASKEDRTKRLEAGKEKLAAFRNKKAKSKRKHSDNALDQNMQQLQNLSSDQMFNVREDNSPTETLSSTDGTNWSVSPHTQIRISELEGAMQEKQLDLDIDFGDSLQWNNFSEVESALSQRNELLSQLTQSLQSSLGHPTLTDDFMTQVCSLAEHICTLQAQLHQADEDLQEQLILRESSMISLQAAKAQILQLQVIITHKDKEITSMTQLLRASNGALDANGLKDEHISHIQQLLEQQTGQLLAYQTQLEAKEVELNLLKEEWFTKEHELITSLSAGSEELSSLKKSQDSWKLETNKLQEKCLHLQSALDEKESADIRLQELEHQLEELRTTHEIDSKEIAALRQKNQDHSECLSSHQSLQISYETVMKQHSDCLLQLEHFKELSSDLQEKLHSLSLVEDELSALKQQFDILNASYLNEVDKCSHLEHRLSELSTTSSAEQSSLKNTINELGMEISKLQTALYSSKDLNGDNYLESHSGHLVVKGQDLSEFQANLNVNASCTEVDMLSHQVDEQKHTHAEGHFLDQCAQENVDEKIYLRGVIDDLSARLEEKESESHQNMAKLTLLQNDVLSAQHIHGVELSEKDFYLEQMHGKLEELYSERDLLTATVKALELKLKQQSFERSSTESSLVEDRGAVWQAVVFGDSPENCGMEQGGAFIVEDKSPSCEVLENKNQISPSQQGSLQPSEADGEHLSEVDKLKEDFGYLSLQVKTLQMALNTTTSELAITKESLETVTAQLVTKASSDHLEEGQLETTKSYEDPAVSLKLVSLQLEEKEVAQLELQSQLETTVSQWQKLQLIVQEKEIDIQNLQENLEEQKRISSTMVRAHQEEGDSLRSVIDSLKSQQESDCSQISNLENEIFSIMTERDIVKSKLLELEAIITERDIELKSLKEIIFNNTVEIDDLKSNISVKESALNESQTKLVAVEMEVCDLRSTLLTRQSEMQSVVREQDRFQRAYSENFSRPAGYSESQNGEDMGRISEKDEEINILKSLDAKNQTVIDELSHSQAESKTLVSLLRNELSLKEKELDGHKLKLSELESTLCSVQSKLMELEGEGKEHKTKLDETEVESVSLKKKHCAQTLKLKASKKVIAQKEEKIAKMDSLLSEKEEEILNLFKNCTDKDEEISNLLKKVTDKEETISNLHRNATEKDEEISNLLKIVTENDEEISKFLKIITEKDEEITDLNRSISNTNYNTSDMSKSIAEKDEHIERLNRELNEKNGEATGILERLAKREDEINELTRSVTLKEEDIAGMSLVITEKVVEVTDLKERLSKKDAEFDNLWKVVGETEKTTAELSTQLTEKDAELANIVQASDKREETLSELRKQLLLKEDEIERLHNTMEERENSECELRKELSQKEEGMASWVGMVGEKEEALSVMSRELISGREERANLLKSVAEKDDEILNLNKVLIEKEKLLDENHLAFVKQEDKIAELQRILKEKAEEMSNLFVNATDKDVIDELRTSLSHCDATVIKLTQNLKVKDVEVNELQMNLIHRDATIIELTQNLKVKDEDVNELQMNLSHRNAIIIELNKTLKVKDEEVSELQINLSHELNKVDELTQHLTHKDEEIIELHTSLSQKSYEISNALQNVSGNEDDIAGLLKNLNDRDMEITSLNKMLLEKDASIYDLNRTATENDEKIAELDQKLTLAVKEITSMNQVLSEKEALLGILSKKVSEKEEEVSSLHDMLTHKVEEIATLHRNILDKDDEFANIGAERDYQVTQLKIKLAEIEEELSQSQKNISLNEEVLTDLMKKLNEKEDNIFKMGQVITKQEQDLSDLQQQLNEKETEFETRYHDVTGEHLQNLQDKDVQISELNRMLTEKDQEVTKLLQNVQDKDIQVSELNLKLLEKDQEITKVLQNFQDKDIEYTEINRKLTEKDQEISELLQNAEDKEIQIGELNRKLTEKDQEISELQQNAQDKDIEYTDLNRKLTEKDQEFSKLLQNAQNKDIEYTDLNRKLTEKDQEISELHQNAQDNDIEYTDLNRKLTEKDVEISELLQTVEDKDIQVGNLNRKLAEKDQDINDYIRDVQNKDVQLAELNIKLSEKDLEITKHLQTSQDKEINLTMLTEKDQEISQLLKNVQDKSNQIVELNKVLAVKDQEINELLQNVQDKDVEYTEINRKLIEKDQEISKLLQNAEDKEIQFGELNRKLTEKDQEISELLQNAKDKDIEYTDLNRKLSEKDQEISEILQNAQDNDIEYTDLSRKLTEKDQEISELLQNAQDKDIEYTDLNRRLTEKDQEISEILQNAQDKEHVFSKQITDMQIELVALQRNVSDHVEIVTELNRSITLKDEVIQNMINNFSEKETEIVELKIKLSEKDEENARLLHVVNKKEEELANSNRVSDDISEKMADMEEEAANLNRDLIEKEAEIFNAHKIITEKSDELTELQLKFIEKEQELVSALQSCSDKEERLVNSTGQLLNKEEEISNKIQVISEKDAQVAHLDRLLTEKDAELANVSRNSFVLEEEQNIFANERGKMREMLLEKEADIETKMLQLSEMEAGIKEMSEKLHEREAGLSALVQKLLVQESETKELTRKLSEKENDIDEIRTRLSLEVTTINEELSVRLQDLVEINAKLSAKEAEVNDLSSQLGEKEDNLSEIYETLSKKESVIGELSLNMTGKDAEIYKQSQILVEKDLDMKKMDQVIREWEALIDEIQMKLTEQEGCIVDLNELLAGKETEISELIKQVTVNEAVILNNVLVEKEKEVNALRDEVSSKCQDIDALTMTLKDKDLELTGMNNRITEAEAQLSAIKIIVANKESDHDNCLSQLNSKERDMETLKHISLSLKSEISLLTSRLTDSESLIIELTTRSETLTLEVLNLHVQLREKEFELGRVFQDKSVSDMQLVELTQQLERLEKELREVSQARELVNSSAFVEGQENIHAVKSATVQESHNKVIHGDQSSDCEGDSKDMDWNVERDNMLQSLEVMQQYITEKDLEISKLLVCLDQEKANSARLLLDLTSSKRNNAGLESWISYTLEKMEEKESVMICQELQLEEHSAKIAHFLNSGKESVSSAQQFAEATPFNSNGTLPIAHAQAPKGVDMVDSHHIMQETDLVVKLGKKESGPCSVDMEKNYCLALSQLTLITEECQQKDGLLIKQSLQLEHYSQQIAELSSNLEHERLLFAETTASCTSVREENDNLTAQCQTLLEDHHHLKQQMSKLESETESQRLTSSQYLVECNNLSEQITELSNALEAKENVLAEAKTRADSCVKEMNDLKTDIEQKDAENSHLRQSVESLTTALEKSQEERELLKANFDSCMEDMQQRLGVQDMEIQTVRSQLAEQAMNVHHDKDQLKEIFEHQITLLEEKLVQSEKLCEQVLKELADTKAKYSSCTELYENQVSDLESNLHTANSELSKLKDQLSRVKNNHECEFAGLKRLHEIQTTELEDNCLALERNVSELKRQLSEQINKFNKERINFEQTLEFQVSDNEEKRRMYETEIARLKRHLEEMKLDHELEMKNLEKSCESRLYELEDKCCIATNELERLRKSFSAEGDYSEERHRTDLRIEDLETTRRDLEIKNRALEEEVTQLREQVVLREEELRTLLQEAAEKRQEKHVEMSEEISSLKQSLSELSRKHSQALEEIVKRKDAEVTDLLKKNEQLELKSQSLEMYMEQDVVIRQERSEEKSNISDLQSQIASLSEENSSLKRRLLMQKAPERTLRLSSGVEAICPPYSHTSTEFDTTQNVGDECFSPAVEDPVLEGFVAESQEKYKSPSKKPLATAYGNQEPDFVEEENDRFQPEMEHERVLDSPSQLNMHPIREEEIHEGFQPEISDLFLMDTSEEQGQRMMWSAELTVGMSPSHLQIHQQSFDFNTSDESQQDSTKPAGKSNQSQPLSLENENKAVDVTESRINQIKEDLEEQYVMRMRRQEVDLTCKFETQYEQYKNESEQHFAQRIQAVRYEWERKFTKALRKVKKEMERRNSKDLRYQRHDNVIRLNSEGADSASSGVNMPDIAERNEELDEVVEQLHKENQELAEVRDVLLRQIEISQTRGLHDRLQHELQSMLTTRDTVSFQSSTPTPTLVATSPTIEPEENTSYENPGQLADEADGSRSEISESSSVREGFLEEFEEISHQSSQDLPLEWELTSTETGAFEQEPRSIWEVFDGRCVRQDCQEVDTLRIQYEHQLASLQRQLEAERRGNEEQMAQRQEEYTKALSDLRSHLDLEQQDTLDQIITALSHIHTEELQNLISTHQDELSLELAALKLSLEQIYIGKSQLEAAEQKQWHTQQMEALKKQHKEEINRLRAGNVTESEVNVSLTDDYNRLVKRISQDLETSFYNDTNSNSVLESGSPTTSQELQNLLLSQQEEIISLRTKLLTDYQALLLSRSDLMTEQAAEVNKLEVQMQDIQQQYDSQLVSLHEKISSQSDFQEQESEEHHQKLEQDYNNLKSHYENLIQNMEIEFEDKLNSIKDKYEEQISSILLSGIGKNMAEAPTPNLASSSTQHEAQGIFHDVGTVVESIDIYDGTVSSEEGDLISQMKKLESDLLERDTELHKLQNELANEELRSKSLETELSDIQQMVKDLQEEVDAAESRCYHLEELLKDKDAKINQLEEEKKESEKLYRDLQEKESSLSKITTNGHPSGIHGDDSVDAMRQEVSNTVGAGSSVLEELQSDSEGLGESQLFEGNFNSNNNNNYNNSNNNSCDQLTLEDDSETIDDLKEQLEIFRKREQQLRNQMEEKEHTYKDTIEGLRQEFEHDKQFELETIQSEFRIQLEIELRRQAAELAARHSTNDNLFDQAGGQRMESDIPHDKVPSDLSQSAITEPFSPSSSQKCSSSTLHSRSSSVQSDSDNQSQLELMQTGRLDRNEVHMLGSDQVHSLDNTGSTNVEEPSESLSDRGRATPSTHSSPSHLTYVETDSVNSLENTDFKRQMEAIQEEHEARLNELKCLLDEAEEERTSLTFKHQEEMEALRKQLNESEDRYDRLMEGVEMGKHPQLNEIFQDKYDRQLELTKSLMQKDFDDMLKEEKKSFVEKHRTLMKDLMGGREKEEEEMKEKFKAELEQLRQTLTDQFHEQQQRLQEEIDRLTMELDELRNHSRGSEGDQVDKKNLTLPEIEEIMLSFQDENTSSASHDGSRDTSTPVKLGDDSDGAINMNESGEFSHHYGSGDLLVHRPDPDGSHVNSDSLHEDTEQNVSSSSHSEPLDPNVNAIEHCEIQIRTFADVVKSPPPLSVNERQQLEHRIQQLMMQVERLTQQLAQFQAAGSMSPPQGSLQFATGTLKGDDTALVAMLQSDLDRISSERESVQRINDRLLSLLSDSVKTYVGVEDTINRRLTQVVSNRSISPTEGGASGHSRPSNGDSGLRGERQGRMNFPATDRNDRKGDADSSHDSQSLENTSFQSNGIDEGLEISQRLAESIFVGPDLDAEGEEILADARGRLQTSVVQLLELMERSTSQLIEAKKTQQELLDALAERAYEMDAMSSKCSDLQTQLAAETEAKDYLGLELHKAEGLISGYSSERESLENQIQSLEQQREAMIVDLDLTRSRLEHFERSQSEMDTMREELNHQQQVLRDNPGQEIQALLGEVAILNKDKRELANQFQQQLDLTRKRINELETQAEESERRHEAAIEEKAHELEDLRLQFENVERQLKASKAFVDEQIQEREQEREEHQKEIERLELMLDAKDRHSNAQQRLQIEITDLTEQLQARIASQSDMHQRTLDLQKALQDKELSAHDLKTWVSQLEKELDQRGSIEEQLKMRISRLERQLTDRTDDNAESTEDDCSASLDLKERSPPMILSPVQTQRVSMISLEEELRRCQQVEQELEHENTALKEQVQVQLLQISGLRNQLDQLRHYSGMEADSDSSHLRIKLQDARDNLEKMEEKLSEAHNRIEVLENTLKLKRDEAELIRVKVTKILDMGSAQEENESLKSQLEELQSQMSHLSSISSLPSFPPELLEEKNQQIEELTEKIVLLEEELTQTQQEEAVHKDKIRQFQMRLKEKDEEISDLQDNINSLRRGEPYLDVSLPMNEDANNLLNISMTGRMPRLDVDDLRTSIQQEFEDTILEREGELRSVKENLTQVTKLLEEKEQELQRLRENLTQLQQNKDKVIALEDSAEHKDSEIYQLTLGSEELRQQIQEHVEARELLEAELRDMEEQLSAAIENKNKCELELHEKEDKLDQMIIQIDSLQHEITSLTGFQNELQEDYDTVQSMLEEKEKEIESLTRELIDNKAHPEALETLLQLEDVVAALQKELLEKDNVVEEKEEELYELRDQLEEMGNVKEEMTKIKSQLEEKCKQAEKLKSDLEEALLKEREALKSTEEGQKEAADNNLVSDTLSQRDRTIAELSEKIVTLEQNLIEFSEKCQENASLGEKIESLDHELLEAKEKAASEKGRLLQQIEETREKYEKYIFDLEEEMKCQANDRSAEITKEQYQTTLEENQCLKLEVVEKQAKVDLLQSKLDSALAEEEEIQEKVHRLECQAREVEELSVVKRQLEEAEEQLRLRQSVMLDIQLEKEKLLEDMTEMETLRKVVEDKDRNIEELESQLRFRQSCILDVEAGRESVVEEKEILETQLRRELAEKEQLIKELQALCVKLKGDDTKEMLQQDKEMNGMIEIGTDVHELRHKLLEASDELVNLSTKYRTLEDRLTQSNYQLTEREEQIHQLQAEIQALQQENSRPHPVAVRVQELQRLVQDKEDTAEAQAIRKRKAELAELRTTVYSELQNATRSSRALNLSASLPMDEVTAGYGGMTRWDSEPAGLALGSRDGTYLRLHMNEVEKLARQQQRELSQKNFELEQVRQNLERWLKMGGQNPMDSLIIEKQTVIISLQTELENLRTEINQKEVLISSLQHDIQEMVRSHSQEKADQDHQITQLQEEIYLLKPSNVMASTPKGQSLSPETKQSISQLKMQLRKAHSALEEMRVSHQMTGEFGAGDANSVQKSGLEQEVEKLRELLKAREDELAVLKAQSQTEQEQAVEKALEEQRQTLEGNHEKYINELILQQQEQVKTIREMTQDTDSVDHGQNIESEVLPTQGHDDSMPQRLQALLERLNQLGEHFLSLPDLRYLKQHLAPVNQGSRSVDSGWDTERKALLATIDALKDLLKQVNILSGQESEVCEDWRSGFLQAFVNIYIKEKDVVQAEVSDASISYPDLDIVTQLETKLQQLTDVHQRSLDDLMRADRQSLISEVSSLHQRLSEAKVQLQSSRDEFSQQVTQLEEAKSKLEWKLQRQVQMLEYKLQQEAVIEDDLKKSLKSERQRVSELSSQSTQERSHVLELQSELSSTQIQLSKAKDSLQREQQRFTSITMGQIVNSDALEEEKAKSARLSELLDATRRKLKTLEEDMTEADRKQQLKSQSEDSYIMDLQSELRKERQRCVQFSEAEDQARRELHEVSDKLDAARRQLASQQMEYEANIEALHRDQMEREVKHRLEGETQTNARLRELLEAERDQHQAALEQERTIVSKQKHEIEILKSQHDQLTQQYENEKSRADSLKINLDQASSDQGAKKTEPDGAVGSNHERNLRLHLKLVEEDREGLRLKVNELELELERVQTKTRELEKELEQARQASGDPRQISSKIDTAAKSLFVASLVDNDLERRLSQCCSKLQSVATQLDSMTSSSQHYRGSLDHTVQHQGLLVDVLSELRLLKGEITGTAETQQKAEDVESRTEQVSRLLEHNQQLANHIVRLKQEKQHIASSLKQMETKLQTSKHAQVNLPQYASDTASEDDVVYDRTVWASERLGLQMALNSAEHEIERLRTEIQQFRSLVHSDRDIARFDPNKTDRLYGKYLRAESFRKALIYQKKYLLLLLGGYRDTEQETLAILASMGGFPTPYANNLHRSGSRAFTMFRSAGRVIIAISRMKYLVKKWKRATRVGSPVMTGQIPPHHSYVPTSSSFPTHPRHHHHHSKPSSSTHHRNTEVPSVPNGDTYTITTLRSPHSYTTPPTKDLGRQYTTKSLPREGRQTSRRAILQNEDFGYSSHPANGNYHPTQNGDILEYLENVHQHLTEGEYGAGRELL